MNRVVYVDTSRTATKRRKSHIAYDGEKIFKIDKLTKFRDVDEVFIDSLFPEIYSEVLELVKRGVKIYVLKDTKVLRKLRIENNVWKSDEVDAVMLSKISRDCFRLLTIEELEKKIEMEPLINEYELLSKRIKILKQWIKNDGYDYGLKDAVKLMEKDKRKIADEIIEASSNNTVYREVCNMLGINNSTELAILTMELSLHLPLTNLKGLLGYTPDKNKNRYNHKLRSHFARLAANLYMTSKKRKSVPEKVIETVKRLPKEKALYKLELITLKALRKAWLETNIANQTLLIDEW